LNCNMCPIDIHPHKAMMDFETFKKVVDRVGNWKKHLEATTITGLGEPMLDKGIYEKVGYLAENKFPSIAVITNGMQFNSKNNHLLMSSGLHKVFISLDGISEKTQDVIRQGSEIKELLRKIESFIALRNDKFPDVKIGMRFTKQSINASEWNDYYNYWNSRLNIDSGDMVLCYDMYNHNGNVVSSDPKQSAVTTCPELTNRMTIRHNGTLSLCCGDHTAETFEYGNASTADPLALYNTGHFLAIRSKLLMGRKSEIPLVQSVQSLSP
jgi:uncharacterized radical SAM superfamily Fe-S cluster-containing enzyme